MDLEDYTSLPTAADEYTVVSVIADAMSGAEGWRLRHATCLVVPQRCAEVSWRAWAAAQARKPETTIYGASLPAAACVRGNGWLLARQPVDPETARDWLARAAARADTGAHDAGAIPALGIIPALHGELSRPSAVIRAMPRAASAVGNLIIGAVRPAAGVLWRAARQPLPFDPPPHVQVGDMFSSWPTRDLSGIHLTPSWVAEGSQTPEGLFVGRLERRAWLIAQRGTEHGDHKLAYLAWDPEYVDQVGLSLQVEEFDDAGELVLS